MKKTKAIYQENNIHYGGNTNEFYNRYEKLRI